MCVYHYEDSKRAQVWICVLLLAAILFSLAAAAPMFIVTYPGDECLLFVSVRGEALIYGNPAGCNFIAYGHCVVILLGKIPYTQNGQKTILYSKLFHLAAIIVVILIFGRRRKGILRRKSPKEIGSTR